MALQRPANTQDEDELMAHISQPKRTNFSRNLLSPPLLNRGRVFLASQAESLIKCPSLVHQVHHVGWLFACTPFHTQNKPRGKQKNTWPGFVGQLARTWPSPSQSTSKKTEQFAPFNLANLRSKLVSTLQPKGVDTFKEVNKRTLQTWSWGELWGLETHQDLPWLRDT